MSGPNGLASDDTEEPARRIERAILALDFDAAEQALDALIDQTFPWAKGLRSAMKFNRSQEDVKFALESGGAASLSGSVAGSWILNEDDGEVRVRGDVFGQVPRVFIFVNQRMIRVLNTVPAQLSGGPVSRFDITFKKSVVSRLPQTARFSVSCQLGPLAIYDKNGHFTLDGQVTAPDAKGDLFELLKGDSFISKHGGLMLKQSARSKWQDDILDAYVDFSKYFEDTFGYKLFLIYGTLLGLVREGGFIGHDDDLDVAYLSHKTTAEDIRVEMIEIVERMRADGQGFIFPVNRAFFHHKAKGVFFDVFPGWIENGHLWMNNTTSIVADRSMIEPIQELTFKGRRVYIPNNPVDFLEKKYGPGWTKPDPGYQYARKGPGVEERLALARFTEKDIELLSAKK